VDATWKLLGSTMKFIEGGFHRGEFFPGRDAWDTGGGGCYAVAAFASINYRQRSICDTLCGGCYAAEETENREIIYPICI